MHIDRGVIIIGTDSTTIAEHMLHSTLNGTTRVVIIDNSYEITRTDNCSLTYSMPERLYDNCFIDSYSIEQFKYIAPKFDFLLPYDRPKNKPLRKVFIKAFHHVDIDYG